MIKIHSSFPLDLIQRRCSPGEILQSSGGQLRVCCGSGVLRIDTIQLEGKRMLETGEFLRGFKISRGEKFDDRRKGR
jgi:methionyl-tRNA formyltransferase